MSSPDPGEQGNNETDSQSGQPKHGTSCNDREEDHEADQDLPWTGKIFAYICSWLAHITIIVAEEMLAQRSEQDRLRDRAVIRSRNLKLERKRTRDEERQKSQNIRRLASKSVPVQKTTTELRVELDDAMFNARMHLEQHEYHLGLARSLRYRMQKGLFVRTPDISTSEDDNKEDDEEGRLLDDNCGKCQLKRRKDHDDDPPSGKVSGLV